MLTLNLELINIFVWFGNNEKFVYSIHSLEYFLLCVWLYKNLLFFFCLFFNEHTHTNLCMRFSKTDELMKEWRARKQHTDTNHIRIKNDFFCPLKFAFSVRVAIKTHSQKKMLVRETSDFSLFNSKNYIKWICCKGRTVKMFD